MLIRSYTGPPNWCHRCRLGGFQYHRRVLPVLHRPDGADHELHGRRLGWLDYSLPFVLFLPPVRRPVLVHRPRTQHRS